MREQRANLLVGGGPIETFTIDLARRTATTAMLAARQRKIERVGSEIDPPARHVSNALDRSHEVADLGLDHQHHRAVAERRVRTEQQEGVREPRHGEAEPGAGTSTPDIRQARP